MVFDDSDYEDVDMGVWSQTRAVHMNLEMFGREDWSPEHLLKIMNAKSHAHLVWFSKRIGLSNNIDFVWTLAHELRHLEQDWRNPLISRASFFLYKAVMILSPSNGWWLLPAELDAELTARRVTTLFYGDSSVVDRLAINNVYDEARLEFLRALPMEEEVNVEKKIAEFIRTNMPQLVPLLDHYDSDLDLLEVCEALDPSPETGR